MLAEDRTEARRLEAIRRDFVVNVSHELKTPVGALSLLAETVGAAADDPEAVRRFAERMQREAARLSALVHEIIELSRLQVAGALEPARPGRRRRRGRRGGRPGAHRRGGQGHRASPRAASRA